MSKLKRRPKVGKTTPWGNLAPVRKGAVWAQLRALTEFQRNKARGGRRR